MPRNIAWALTAIIAFVFIFNKVKLKMKWRANLPFLIVILKKSFPFALAVFLMTAYTRLDIVILEWLLPDGPYHAGVYCGGLPPFGCFQYDRLFVCRVVVADVFQIIDRSKFEKGDFFPAPF